MVSDVEHLLMYSLGICVSSLKKHLFKSFAHFFKLAQRWQIVDFSQCWDFIRQVCKKKKKQGSWGYFRDFPQCCVRDQEESKYRKGLEDEGESCCQWNGELNAIQYVGIYQHKWTWNTGRSGVRVKGLKWRFWRWRFVLTRSSMTMTQSGSSGVEV